MPSRIFTTTLTRLSPADSVVIKGQISAWKSGGTFWAQIAENIENENALEVTRFTNLLKDFAAKLLVATANPEKSWCDCCELHQFAGQEATSPDRPEKLGRAGKFDMFLKYAKTTDARFKGTIIKYAGKKPPTFLKNELAKQKLGGNVIFATFNELDRAGDPFAGLPRDRAGIRTALGLGQPDHATPDPYLLFTYASDEPPSLPLHRPTIADAGDFSHFRPGKSAKDKCGWTFPLPPNSRKLPAKPELIHKQIIGDRLVFPYEISAP